MENKMRIARLITRSCNSLLVVTSLADKMLALNAGLQTKRQRFLKRLIVFANTTGLFRQQK
jgi:hypothetical protein